MEPENESPRVFPHHLRLHAKSETESWVVTITGGFSTDLGWKDWENSGRPQALVLGREKNWGALRPPGVGGSQVGEGSNSFFPAPRARLGLRGGSTQDLLADLAS